MKLFAISMSGLLVFPRNAGEPQHTVRPQLVCMWAKEHEVAHKERAPRLVVYGDRKATLLLYRTTQGDSGALLKPGASS